MISSFTFLSTSIDNDKKYYRKYDHLLFYCSIFSPHTLEITYLHFDNVFISKRESFFRTDWIHTFALYRWLTSQKYHIIDYLNTQWIIFISEE